MEQSFVNKALELLEGKDEIEASNDVVLINRTLETYTKSSRTGFNKANAIQADALIRAKYPIIAKVENSLKDDNVIITDVVECKLNNDRLGILYYVLLKHGIITTVKEVI